MPEYIDKEKYCAEACRCNKEKCDKSKCPIWNAPAADVTHVIHGKNLTECNPVDEFICSHCGAIFRDVALCEIDEDSGDETYYEFEFKHCPRCGMKVDLEEDK